MITPIMNSLSDSNSYCNDTLKNNFISTLNLFIMCLKMPDLFGFRGLNVNENKG